MEDLIKKTLKENLCDDIYGHTCEFIFHKCTKCKKHIMEHNEDMYDKSVVCDQCRHDNRMLKCNICHLFYTICEEDNCRNCMGPCVVLCPLCIKDTFYFQKKNDD